MVMEYRIMMQHFGINDCLFREGPNKIAKVSVRNILDKKESTIIGAMLSRGLFTLSIVLLYYFVKEILLTRVE